MFHGARMLSIFYHYFVITKTLNLSHVKWKWVYLEQYSPIKTLKALWENNIHTL